MKKYFFSGFLVPLQFLIPVIAFSQHVVTITDCNLNGWVKETPPGTSLTFKNSPPVPLLGKGSLEFVSLNTNGVRIRCTSYHNTLLSSLTELSYSTYIHHREDRYNAIKVQLLIDRNGNGTADDRLVFDPFDQTLVYPFGQVVEIGAWQTWEMLNGIWVLSSNQKLSADPYIFGLASYLRHYPNARIVNDKKFGEGGISLFAGHPIFVPNIQANADNFSIGISGVTTVYDFEFTSADAGPDRAVVGHGSNCITLSATAAGGVPPYTYSWFPGGSAPGSPNTEVCPTVTTTYTLTVIDANGCTRTDDVTVFVNERCVNDLSKVRICHNGTELCIPAAEVQNHLDHGDLLGGCPSSTTKAVVEKLSETVSTGQLKLSNYPNPFSESTTIQYEIPFDCNVSVKIYDLTGRLLSSPVSENKRSGLHQISFNGKNLSSGIYYCQITGWSGMKFFTRTIRMIRID